MSFTNFRARLRHKISRMIEPIAHDLLAWSRGSDTRFKAIEHTLESLENTIASDRDRGIWAREALVERLNESSAREAAYLERGAFLVEKVAALELALEHLRQGHDSSMTKLGKIEDRQNQDYWAREALVERLNFIEARDVLLQQRVELQIQTIDRQIDDLRGFVSEKTALPTAMDLEALAIRRRLAAIEDDIERLSDCGSPAQKADLVTFPRPSDIDREKAVG